MPLLPDLIGIDNASKGKIHVLCEGLRERYTLQPASSSFTRWTCKDLCR